MPRLNRLSIHFMLGVGIYMMFHFIGISFLSGVGVLFVMLIINTIVGKKTWAYYMELMATKDVRTKAVSEMLS